MNRYLILPFALSIPYIASAQNSEENIKLAYRTIKKNTGSDTSGVDKRTIADLAKLSEEEYARLIRKQFSKLMAPSKNARRSLCRDC